MHCTGTCTCKQTNVDFACLSAPVKSTPVTVNSGASLRRSFGNGGRTETCYWRPLAFLHTTPLCKILLLTCLSVGIQYDWRSNKIVFDSPAFSRVTCASLTMRFVKRSFAGISNWNLALYSSDELCICPTTNQILLILVQLELFH